MGLNTQKPRNVGGPSAAGKLHVDQSSDDEDLALRRKIIEVRFSINNLWAMTDRLPGDDYNW